MDREWGFNSLTYVDHYVKIFLPHLLIYGFKKQYVN